MEDVPTDFYTQHTENEIQDYINHLDSLLLHQEITHFHTIGRLNHQFRSVSNLPITPLVTRTKLKQFYIKQRILNNLMKKILNDSDLTEMQYELLSIIDTYKDLYYPERNHENGESIRLVYCIHIMNHLLKTKFQIRLNDTLMANTKNSEEYRDQGLTKPKVLVLLPFRESAYRTINCLINLIRSENVDEGKVNVLHYKRFKEEFYSENVAKINKPNDFNQTFFGNTDDTFRIGIIITKKTLKLYSDFYSSDIIVSSPLGLRMLIGAEGEDNRNYDFLNSIEILIIDQADLFLMQNWEHVLDIFKHLHLLPSNPKGIEFSRVRMWALDGYQKFYRQNLIFSSIDILPISSLFKKECHNYEGLVMVKNIISNANRKINLVIAECSQTFLRFDSTSLSLSPQDRFKFFIERVFTPFREVCQNHVMIFIPSYFDFVRLRNYFRKEDISFTQICEYTKEGKIAQSRKWFCNGGRNILLYTERCHFFKRYIIKGIRHLVFYQLPTYPQFYSELVNLVHSDYQGKKFTDDKSSMTCTVIYDKYDIQLLEHVVGTEKATEMVYSENDILVFETNVR